MNNILKERSNFALELMEASGYGIEEEVLFEVDNELPFMGYTTERDGKTVIVIAGWSLSTDMSLGLMIHELSHVYRIQTFHPSHNTTLHDEIIHELFPKGSFHQYEIEALHTIINSIQDLYADDISFDVYFNDSQKENINEFFLGWIKTPITEISEHEDKWKNAQMLINTAFAQANLERHSINDANSKIEKAVRQFLKKVEPQLALKYEFFKTCMVHFPENATDEEFKNYLKKFITEFLTLTK